MASGKKVYANEVKGYIFEASSFSFPANTKYELAIRQPYIVLQCFLLEGVPLNIEISVKTDDNNKKRLIFASAFKELSSSTFHIKVPLNEGIPRNVSKHEVKFGRNGSTCVSTSIRFWGLGTSGSATSAL